MDIPRDLIEVTRSFIEDNESIKMIHYRELNPEITDYNYGIGTEVHFKEILPEFDGDVHITWKGLLNSIKIKHNNKLSYNSKSFSHYIHDDQRNIYRFSDHWGTVSSCHWMIGDHPSQHGTFRIGVANLEDFKPFIGKLVPEKHLRLNPVWKEKMLGIEPVRDRLLEIKKSKEFKSFSLEDKKLIGENFGLLDKTLKIAESE